MSPDREKEMGSEITRASADLDSSRESFVLSMGALEREVTRTLDWRDWVRRRPGTALVLAFGIGLFLGRRR